MFGDMNGSMAEYFYRMHYHEIKTNFTEEQKQDIAKRISELTLHGPIWLDRNTDYMEQFPELKPHINCPLTGLYLCAIMKGILEDLQGIDESKQMVPF